MKKLNKKRHWIATPTLSARNDAETATTRCPTKTFGHDRRGGFTLVELVIVIAIVIILSVVSVPIYRNYTDKAIMSEGYALLGVIVSAQKAYYSEYGMFLHRAYSSSGGDENYLTSKEDVLGIDARGNKYFTTFCIATGNAALLKEGFHTWIVKPARICSDPSKPYMQLYFNITKGSSVTDNLDHVY